MITLATRLLTADDTSTRAFVPEASHLNSGCSELCNQSAKTIDGTPPTKLSDSRRFPDSCFDFIARAGRCTIKMTNLRRVVSSAECASYVGIHLFVNAGSAGTSPARCVAILSLASGENVSSTVIVSCNSALSGDTLVGLRIIASITYYGDAPVFPFLLVSCYGPRVTRIARIVVPGSPHHVTQRGNRRERVFFEDADYELYRDYGDSAFY
jgi:hypothetical protein